MVTVGQPKHANAMHDDNDDDDGVLLVAKCTIAYTYTEYEYTKRSIDATL